MNDWIELPSGDHVNLKNVVRARWGAHVPGLLILELVGRVDRFGRRPTLWLYDEDAEAVFRAIEDRARRPSSRRRGRRPTTR